MQGSIDTGWRAILTCRTAPILAWRLSPRIPDVNLYIFLPMLVAFTAFGFRREIAEWLRARRRRPRISAERAAESARYLAEFEAENPDESPVIPEDRAGGWPPAQAASAAGRHRPVAAVGRPRIWPGAGRASGGAPAGPDGLALRAASEEPASAAGDRRDAGVTLRR